MIDLSKHNGLYPAKPTEGKNNFKRTYRINRDGAIREVIRLRVLDERLREEIIFTHFLSSYTRWILREDTTVRIHGRDAPWDFSAEVGCGDVLNVEITAIAGDDSEFKAMTREDRLGRIVRNAKIPLSLLKKLHKDFPHERAQEIIGAARACGAERNVEVENPWFGTNEPLYVRYSSPASKTLVECLTTAIVTKAAKRHSNKAGTVLVIDNRSTDFELPELREAAPSFDRLAGKNPFKDVWLYTGYYSDFDGSNAEWALTPVLLSATTLRRFEEALELSGQTPNEAGIIYSGFK